MNTKTRQLLQTLRLYLEHPEGISDSEIAKILGIHRSSANHYHRELEPFGVKIVKFGKYTIEPSEELLALATLILSRINDR